MLPGHPLARHIEDFLADLANANKPRNTIRAYRGDLISFAAHHDGEIAGVSPAPVRAFLGEVAGQAPATRKRKRAAVASFCKWAVRRELLDASPMDRIDAIEVPRTLPRPAAAAEVAAVLDAICSRRPRKDVPVGVLRDRVLFETAYTCGARASEVYGIYVEDLDLRPDDEHARVHGKGGAIRTVLLDDRGTSRCSGSTSPGPGTRRARCSAPASTAAAARCPTARRTAGGRSTAPPPAPGSASTSSATPTPPNSTASPSGSCAAASATPPPRPPRSTPCSPTTLPTPRSAPRAANAR